MNVGSINHTEISEAPAPSPFSGIVDRIPATRSKLPTTTAALYITVGAMDCGFNARKVLASHALPATSFGKIATPMDIKNSASDNRFARG